MNQQINQQQSLQNKKPLSYLDLVVKAVRGQSPVPELQNLKIDRKDMAKDHVKGLREKFKNKSSGNLMFDMVLSIGGSLLAKTWDKLSPPALTMCGDKSINQLLEALSVIHKEKIAGDFIEAGVWRGGLPIVGYQTPRKTQKIKRQAY